MPRSDTAAPVAPPGAAYRVRRSGGAKGELMALCAMGRRLPVPYVSVIVLAVLVAQAASGPARARGSGRHVAAEATRAAFAVLGSPTGALQRREPLEAKGMIAGSPILLRIFKAESELELWVLTDGRFALFARYPICFWSGTLGPKLREGDEQAPEGLYSVGAEQLHRTGRRPRSFDIGYPNALDRAAGRTGSHIFIHGGCASRGCYAMTDAATAEIFALGEQALIHGQERFPVQVFPFRMSGDNMAKHADSHWLPFWADLKQVYDAFERTHLPPQVVVRCGRYVVLEDRAGTDGGTLSAEAAAEQTSCASPNAAGLAPAAAAQARRVRVRVGGDSVRHRRHSGAEQRHTRRAHRAPSGRRPSA